MLMRPSFMLAFVIILAAISCATTPAMEPPANDDSVPDLESTDGATLQENSMSRLTAIAKRPDTRIRIAAKLKATVVDVRSDFGIDTATLRRESQNWPRSLIVRLHLRGLESFRVTVGETSVEWSVSSTHTETSRASLRTNGDETTLDETSPYFSAVRIVGDNPAIPLKDGYFEVSLPAKLLEENPEEITLRWIDFYRN